MFRKKNRSKKRTRAMLSAYSIIMILIILLGILSHVLPKAQYMAAPVDGTGEELLEVDPGTGEWEGEVPADERMNEVGEINTAEKVVPVAEDAKKVKTYESLDACEDVNGEDGCVIVDGSGVEGAKLYQILMSPISGFADAIDVCIFVMVLGGFLAIMAKTKALENGIKILVKKLHGKEYLLILLLMLIF